MDYAKWTESLENLMKNDDLQSLIKDDAARIRLMEAARVTSLKFEKPFESYFRLIFSDMPAGLALAGVELEIWQAIATKLPNSVSVSELAKQLVILESTLAGILRFAATQYMLDEVGEDIYRANNITYHFTAPRAESDVFLA